MSDFLKQPIINDTIKDTTATKPDHIYTVNPNNWYTTLPYGFRFTPRTSDGSKGVQTFFLPINPSDIRINTSFATNGITTLYGVVEEHSEVRYYDVVISGTTGFAPRHVNTVNQGSGLEGPYALSGDDAQKWKSTGRSSQTTASISLGGFLPQLTNAIDQAKGTFQEITGTGPVNSTGVFTDQTGYLAFHNFYRFLLLYKKDASGENGFETRKKHPLTWLNYKDGTKMDCMINNFSMTRSASNPFMYDYSIQMRCYNLRGINTEDQTLYDTAGMGLSSGLDILNNPLFAQISNKAKAVTNAINSITGWF